MEGLYLVALVGIDSDDPTSMVVGRVESHLPLDYRAG
jgi:hypothetical protein